MSDLREANRRRRLGRTLAILACVVGIVGDAAIQTFLVGPVVDGRARQLIDASGAQQAATVLIAMAHDWSEDAARLRADLAAKEAARQARIDAAMHDLLDHD